MKDPWQERLSEMLDGELADAELAQICEHLSSCEACRTMLEELRSVQLAARELEDPEPPPEVWARIEASLPSSHRRAPSRLALVATAAVVVIVATIWLSRQRAADDGLSAYMLVLHEPPGMLANATPDEVRDVVAVYSAWATELARQGRLDAGEKLAEDGWSLRRGNEPEELAGDDGVVGGFFVIRAEDVARAKEIASGCPHLEYGGWIELHRIEG